MTIEGVASYAEIYSETLTDEDIKRFNLFGVEWRGRNILDIRDDFCIKAIGVFALIYAQKAFTNPKELPQLKAEIIQIFEDLFDTEVEDENEPSPLLYRFDPISGTYRELIGAEGKFLKKTCKKVGKGFKKAKKAVAKGARETGRWVREHPVETAVIVVGVVVGGAGVVAAVGGAVEGAVRSDDNHNKDKPTTSRTPANSSLETNAQPSISADASSKFIPPSPTDQPFVLPNQFIPYNQVFMPPPEGYNISKPPIYSTAASGSSSHIINPSDTNHFSSGYTPIHSSGPGNIAKSIPETRPAGVEFTTPNASIVPDKQQNLTDSSDKSFAERTREIVSGPVHEGWKCIGILGKNTLQLVEDLNPSIAKGLQESKTLREAWEEEAVPFVHEKIDKLFSTNIKDDFDPKKDGAVDQALQNFFLNPLIGLGGVASTESVVSQGAKVGTAGNIFGNAGKVFANEAFAVEKTIQAGLNTSLIGKELGFTTREMTQLKQAGKLEGTIAHAYENVVKVPAIRESIILFEKAGEKLKPHQGVYMSESQVRELIQATGIPTFARPKGIPENYRIKLSDKPGGIKFVHPVDEGTYVRIMPGKPHSKNPRQQRPYVNQRINGKSVDKHGNMVLNKSEEAHIPLEEFVYKETGKINYD